MDREGVRRGKGKKGKREKERREKGEKGEGKKGEPSRITVLIFSNHRRI